MLPAFAQHFGINLEQAQLDFVDIDPEQDIPLFLDPFVFAVSSGSWAETCNYSILSFFQTALDLVQAGDDPKGQALLDNLSEPNETCLGMSSGRPAGRGVSGKQAFDLYERLKRSRAAQTGLLSDLSECELFIEGIGPDKISDITTNIIRNHLISYTQEQCQLYGIELVGQVASGLLWNTEEQRWYQEYVALPVIHGKIIILVPKASVRWSLSFSHQEYYNRFVLEFLQAEHLSQNTALVETLKNGRRRVTKKSLKEIHPLSRDFLSQFTENHPEVLERYRAILGIPPSISDDELISTFDEAAFAQVLSERLELINPGNDSASAFHDFMKGVLEFLFYPHLIYLKKEFELHEGRKRIDIVFTNSASVGFFYRRAIDARSRAVKVMIECKKLL